MRGLYQALAVASMCIQEQAAARPLIGDVVTALSYLANQAYEPNGHGHRGSGDRDEKRQRDERGGQLSRNEEGGGSGRRWDLDGSEKEDSPRETAKMLNRDLDRERAVVEAKMWGEKIKEQKKGNPEKQKKREHTEKNRDKLKQKTQKTNVNVTVFLIASCKSEKEEPKQKAVTFIITETKGKQKGKSYADESKTTAL
jgi:hypothetical protein